MTHGPGVLWTVWPLRRPVTSSTATSLIPTFPGTFPATLPFSWSRCRFSPPFSAAFTWWRGWGGGEGEGGKVVRDRWSENAKVALVKKGVL